MIDDDPMIRDLLPRALAQPDLHFETATNGEEGLELATALLPDLIILDLLMPGMDGWAVLRQLKANPATAAIPVVLLTIDSEGERGLVLGAAACLHKPVEIGQLTRMIASLLHDRTPPQRVLLVEDDGELRNYLQRVLIQHGWEVDTAADGVEALALFDQRAPDLAIVDLMLPRMDGISLIGNIRGRPDGETLPILVVTAKELTPHEHEYLNRSVENILRKGSFRGDDLLRSVRALIGYQRQKKPAG
ncbi:MAG: response regulator [Chloroflexaceae bacterium]|nr:response regulator [Chloroflexaceae bacterium]